MKYVLTGKIAIRKEYEAGDNIQHHEEIVEASSPEEAIELSLSGFAEHEEPCWCQRSPIITLLPDYYTKEADSHDNCPECHAYLCQSCRQCHSELICPISKPPCLYARTTKSLHWQKEPEIQVIILLRQKQQTAYSAFIRYYQNQAQWLTAQKDYSLNDRIVAIVVNEWQAEGIWEENPSLSAYASDYRLLPRQII